MQLTLKMPEKKDFKKAIAFAAEGMHFNVYFNNKVLAGLYGRFLLYSGTTAATQMVAAYDGDRFLGLLTARMEGEERCWHSFSESLLINTVSLIAGIFARGGAGSYGIACKKLLDNYKKENQPDGEITFLAADPRTLGQGIGTAMLHEFESREPGKQVYLYTDDECSYQFYDHSGFERVGEEDIVMDLKDPVPLKCMLYSKKIPEEGEK